MRSGEAHCDQELADEVRRGGRRRKEEGGRRRATDIKSNNPHLAGGEQKQCHPTNTIDVNYLQRFPVVVCSSSRCPGQTSMAPRRGLRPAISHARRVRQRKKKSSAGMISLSFGKHDLRESAMNRSMSCWTLKPPPDNLWTSDGSSWLKKLVSVIRRVISTMVDINSLVFKLQRLGAPLDTWTPERWQTNKTSFELMYIDHQLN